MYLSDSWSVYCFFALSYTHNELLHAPQPELVGAVLYCSNWSYRLELSHTTNHSFFGHLIVYVHLSRLKRISGSILLLILYPDLFYSAIIDFTYFLHFFNSVQDFLQIVNIELIMTVAEMTGHFYCLTCINHILKLINTYCH